MENKQHAKKEMILDAAALLFSQKGFEATSIDEIGEAAGLKGPALYYYFKGKDDIIDALVQRMEEYYERRFDAVDADKLPTSYEEFKKMSMNRIIFTIHEPKFQMGRLIIAKGQFRDKRLAKLATRHHLTGLMEFYKIVLEKLVDDEIIKDYPLDLLAFEFVAPITMLIHLIDREPDKEAEALEGIRKHIDHFGEMYCL